MPPKPSDRPLPLQGELFADEAESPPARPPRPARLDGLPDVRDGLTRIERVVLLTLWEIQRERPERDVPSAMLYGRLVERIDITPAAMQELLGRLGGRRMPGG